MHSIRNPFPDAATVASGKTGRVESRTILRNFLFRPKGNSQARFLMEQVKFLFDEVGISRRLRLTRLKDATVRFYPEPDTRDKTTFLLNAPSPFVTKNAVRPQARDDSDGHYLEVVNVNGSLLISW